MPDKLKRLPETVSQRMSEIRTGIGSLADFIPSNPFVEKITRSKFEMVGNGKHTYRLVRSRHTSLARKLKIAWRSIGSGRSDTQGPRDYPKFRVIK